MKRLWSTPEFALRQERRQRKFDRRDSPRQKKLQPTHSVQSTQQRNLNLRAPETLSLFDEPDQTIRFINKLRRYLASSGTTVFLDLSNVRHFTSDALLLIRAIMEPEYRADHTQVVGNLPIDPIVASEFKESGFFSSGFAKPPDNLPLPKGLILEKSGDTVHAEMAAELVEFAERYVPITDRCAYACSQTLIEVMTNTHDHAGDWVHVRGHRCLLQKWFVSVYCQGEIAYFSFIDLGVGILKSVPVRTMLRRIGASIPSYGPISLLKATFEGKLGSATGRPGRGLGLPRMKRDADENRLLDLRVLTSNIVGSVSDLDFRSGSYSLSGTVFRWQTRSESLNND